MERIPKTEIWQALRRLPFLFPEIPLYILVPNLTLSFLVPDYPLSVLVPDPPLSPLVPDRPLSDLGPEPPGGRRGCWPALVAIHLRPRRARPRGLGRAGAQRRGWELGAGTRAESWAAAGRRELRLGAVVES